MASHCAARVPRIAAALVFVRSKVTSAQFVAARALDPTFEKLMDGYKHLFKVVAVQDLILGSPEASLPLPHLSSVAQRLHLNRGAAHFVRAFPRVFSLSYDPSVGHLLIRLTPDASRLAADESSAASATVPEAVDRLKRLLSISSSRSLPLRAVFKVWRELGLPDDFEESVIAANPAVFVLRPNPNEPNTHLLQLIDGERHLVSFEAAVEEWRRRERCREGSKADEAELKFGFKQGFPPGMRLSKAFRAKLKDWQRLSYTGPYEAVDAGKRRRASKAGMRALEKRAVAIAHEFLSLTVEKMVEVEKISHFRKWFGIELNVRDMFLDHPGMFYLSTKGKRHTVFLREAYDRGRLAESNPIYEARMKLLQLVLMRRRGMDPDANPADRAIPGIQIDMNDYVEESSDNSSDSEDIQSA